MSTLFSKYPTINYSNATVTNIFVRTAIRESIRNNVSVFYPYTIKENERPDIIAQDYYGDPTYDWLIYLANDIIDPYYEWPLSNYDFQAFITNKYGSIQVAQQQIEFWRVNWYNDDSFISTSSYSALTSELRKYWTLDAEFNTNYVRKQDDTALETNKIIEVVVANSTGFNIGDRITQTVSGNITATGFISLINDNTLVCKNIIGTFATSVNAASSTKSSNVTGVTTIVNNIPGSEVNYWEYVTRYDYEVELNEQHKHIQVIDRNYVLRIENELRELIK